MVKRLYNSREERLAARRALYASRRKTVSEYESKRRRANPERTKQNRRRAHCRYLAKLRAEVFSRYGGPRCACCGEANPMFLSLDHINNDGAQHRREIAGKNRGGGWQNGWLFYVWLRRNNYPPLALQVLCFNCNLGKWKNRGTCPHLDGANMTSPNGGLNSLAPPTTTQRTG